MHALDLQTIHVFINSWKKQPLYPMTHTSQNHYDKFDGREKVDLWHEAIMILIGIERDFKIFCFKIVSILGNTNAWGILCQFHPLKHCWVSKMLIYPRAYTKEPSSFKKMSFLYVCIVFQKRQLAKYNSQQGCIGVKF